MINSAVAHKLDKKLANRIIANAAALMDWSRKTSAAAWKYVVNDEIWGGTATRYKALNSSASKKYWWGEDKTGDVVYYHPPGIFGAVKRANGVLFIAAGEIDVLTYMEAGIYNVIAWFGEKSVPATLADDLQKLGVSRAIFAVDRDSTGKISGKKTKDYLRETGIHCEIKELPESIGDKGDTNDLWNLLEGDSIAFLQAIENAPELELPLPEPKPQITVYSFGNDETPPELIQEILHGINARNGFTGRKWRGSLQHHCIHGQHEDKKASAYFDPETGVIKCFACDSTRGKSDAYSPIENAERLGIDWRRFYPNRRNMQRRIQSSTGDSSKSLKREVAVPEPPPVGYTPFEMPPVEADVVVNKPYLSAEDFADGGDYLIISGTGTGKTEAVADIKKTVNTSLAISHRQALAENIANRYGSESYKNVPSEMHASIDHFSTCVNSNHHLIKPNEPAPKYGLVAADEVQQIFKHLGGDTFRGRESERSYLVTGELYQRAGRFFAMDAFATNVIVQELRRKRPNLKVLVNTYRRNRGPLHVYSDIAKLIEKAQVIADLDEGPIVIATNSQKEAKKLEKYFNSLYGEEDVRAIYGEISDEHQIQVTIRNIEHEIFNYRVVIYTPTLGSGFDINPRNAEGEQIPIRAVFGIFFSEPLDAPDCHQMLARVRCTKETHVFVQKSERNLETDPDKLYEQALDNAVKTGEFAEFDEYGIAVVSDTQKHQHRLLCNLKAEENASKNRLHDHFMTIAVNDGYGPINYDERRNRIVREQLNAVREEVTLEEIQRHLDAKPIDPITFEQRQMEGQVTREEKAGRRRWSMEKAAGQELTRDIWKYVGNSDDRRRIYMLKDVLHSDLDELKERDRENTNERLTKRKHTTRKVLVTRQLLRAVFGECEIQPDTTIEKSHIETVVSEFYEVYRDEIHNLFGRRTDKSKKAIPLLRWLMQNVLGIRLSSTQIMEECIRRRVYFVAIEDWEVLERLAKQCRERELQDEEEKQKQKQPSQSRSITQKREERIYIPAVVKKSDNVYTRWKAQIEAIPF